jgi:hypothetical protein
MGDEATPATLTQVNAEFLSARASRLDGAISKALAGRIEAPAAPKASKGPSKSAAPASSTAAATPAAASPASTESSTQPASEPSESSGGATPEPSTTDQPDADEPQDGPAEAEPAALDLDRGELDTLAKKKDRRGIEKMLGLKEGTLGVGDHDYATYRRRVGEVEARERTVQATHEQNNQTLIKKFGPAVEMIERAQKGDLVAYARSIELTSGIRIETFIDHWSKNMPRLDPRVMALEQENVRLRAQTPPSTAQDTPAQPPAPDAARKKADSIVLADAKEHAALKLRGGLDDVRAKWLGSFNKATNSFGLTPTQAADAVLDDRRKAHEQEQWVLSGKKPPKKPVTRAVTRTGASESQPRKQNLTREQIIDQHAKLIQRQKIAERR